MNVRRWHVVATAAIVAAVAMVAIHDAPSKACATWREQHKRALMVEAVTGNSVTESPKPKGCDR